MAREIGIYEEQVWSPEDLAQDVYVAPAAIGTRASGPTEAEIDQMTPDQVKQLTLGWSYGVGSSHN